MAHAMSGAERGAAVGPGDVPSDRYLEIRVAARSNRDVEIAADASRHIGKPVDGGLAAASRPGQEKSKALPTPPKRSLDGSRIARQHVTDVRIRIRANVAATNVVYAVRVR